MFGVTSANIILDLRNVIVFNVFLKNKGKKMSAEYTFKKYLEYKNNLITPDNCNNKIIFKYDFANNLLQMTTKDSFNLNAVAKCELFYKCLKHLLEVICLKQGLKLSILENIETKTFNNIIYVTVLKNANQSITLSLYAILISLSRWHEIPICKTPIDPIYTNLYNTTCPQRSNINEPNQTRPGENHDGDVIQTPNTASADEIDESDNINNNLPSLQNNVQDIVHQDTPSPATKQNIDETLDAHSDNSVAGSVKHNDKNKHETEDVKSDDSQSDINSDMQNMTQIIEKNKKLFNLPHSQKAEQTFNVSRLDETSASLPENLTSTPIQKKSVESLGSMGMSNLRILSTIDEETHDNVYSSDDDFEQNMIKPLISSEKNTNVAGPSRQNKETLYNKPYFYKQNKSSDKELQDYVDKSKTSQNSKLSIKQFETISSDKLNPPVSEKESNVEIPALNRKGQHNNDNDGIYKSQDSTENTTNNVLNQNASQNLKSTNTVLNVDESSSEEFEPDEIKEINELKYKTDIKNLKSDVPNLVRRISKRFLDSDDDDNTNKSKNFTLPVRKNQKIENQIFADQLITPELLNSRNEQTINTQNTVHPTIINNNNNPHMANVIANTLQIPKKNNKIKTKIIANRENKIKTLKKHRKKKTKLNKKNIREDTNHTDIPQILTTQKPNQEVDVSLNNVSIADEPVIITSSKRKLVSDDEELSDSDNKTIVQPKKNNIQTAISGSASDSESKEPNKLSDIKNMTRSSPIEQTTLSQQQQFFNAMEMQADSTLNKNNLIPRTIRRNLKKYKNITQGRDQNNVDVSSDDVNIANNLKITNLIGPELENNNEELSNSNIIGKGQTVLLGSASDSKLKKSDNSSIVENANKQTTVSQQQQQQAQFFNAMDLQSDSTLDNINLISKTRRRSLPKNNNDKLDLERGSKRQKFNPMVLEQLPKFILPLESKDDSEDKSSTNTIRHNLDDLSLFDEITNTMEI